jgi:uncharacterized protein (UPF0276 family)
MRIEGHGVGLRPEHHDEILAGVSGVDWVEVISENFMVAGGTPRRVLSQVCERYPVVLHGVSLSLGGVDPLEPSYLDALARLVREVDPAWVSDHLCFSRLGGHSGHDLWPIPFAEESLAHVAERVRAVQDRLGRRLLVENVSSYVTYRASTMTEWEFLGELARRADCGLLLDVNNVYVSARNHGFDPDVYLAGLPTERIGQFHLAGHQDLGTHLLDTHDRPVCEEVWQLYGRAVERFGAVPAMIEWDADIPPLARLLEELERARAVAAAAEVRRAA